jgi:hypothetical protein
MSTLSLATAKVHLHLHQRQRAPKRGILVKGRLAYARLAMLVPNAR